jgi:hypothetical protein
LGNVIVVFMTAMREALEFNSYILDRTVEQLHQELQSLNPVIVRKISKRLVELWRSEKLNGQQLVEFEVGQRERDKLADHQTTVLEQLRNW